MYASCTLRAQVWTPGGFQYTWCCVLAGGFYTTDITVVVPLLSIGIEAIQNALVDGIATQLTALGLVDAAAVPVVVTSEEVVLYNPPGGKLVTSDPLEFLILDRTAADFANAANLAAAQALAAAQTALFSTSGWTRFVVTVDITIVAASTALNIAARSSGKAVPLVTVPADWSYFAIDNIDEATGISTTPSYQITVPTPAVGRYTRSFLVWGSQASAVVWVNGAGTRGNVYAQRFGS